ncbi:MAG: ABC transporter ATP-binding protein [Oscillospiraceae bacterium]|nr:ABC transporter ATP-binding protein [Oscillospiraceae bacterium]
MIAVKSFSFRYAGGSRAALDGIDFTINDGEFVGIIGRSGSGKTTLTHAMSGMIPHYFRGDFYGSVEITPKNGVALDTVETLPDTISQFVGSVLQDTDAQMVTSMVWDELRYGLEGVGLSEDEINSRVTEALEDVGISELADREISSLSGGQRQKVAIAAILALRPQILILDEPTGELDPKSSRKVFELLRRLNEQGITVIVVEQKIMQLCEFCKRLIVLNEGRILLDGETKETLTHGDVLERVGVHVPRIVSLYNRLTEQGAKCGLPPCTLDEAEKMVREALS